MAKLLFAVFKILFSEFLCQGSSEKFFSQPGSFDTKTSSMFTFFLKFDRKTIDTPSTIFFVFLAKEYDMFLASSNLIRQVPRLLGPTLNKVNKFPLPVAATEKVEDKVEEIEANPQGQFKIQSWHAHVFIFPSGQLYSRRGYHQKSNSFSFFWFPSQKGVKFFCGKQGVSRGGERDKKKGELLV